MLIAIFDASGACKTLLEQYEPVADVLHLEEIIETMLEGMKIPYELMTPPIYDKTSKIWVTHRLHGSHEGCVAGFLY